MLYLVDWLFPGHCYLHPGPRSVLGFVLLIPWWDLAGLGSVPGFKFFPHCILYQLSPVTSVALCFIKLLLSVFMQPSYLSLCHLKLQYIILHIPATLRISQILLVCKQRQCPQIFPFKPPPPPPTPSYLPMSSLVTVCSTKFR